MSAEWIAHAEPCLACNDPSLRGCSKRGKTWSVAAGLLRIAAAPSGEAAEPAPEAATDREGGAS